MKQLNQYRNQYGKNELIFFDDPKKNKISASELESKFQIKAGSESECKSDYQKIFDDLNDKVDDIISLEYESKVKEYLIKFEFVGLRNFIDLEKEKKYEYGDFVKRIYEKQKNDKDTCESWEYESVVEQGKNLFMYLLRGTLKYISIGIKEIDNKLICAMVFAK